jgi:hypothetical protein
MTAWLRPPMRERRLKATIFRRTGPRSSVLMTESREAFGRFPGLDARVLEKGLFTGPVSAAAAPVEASRSEIVLCNRPWHSVVVRRCERPASA